jgi:hypothetical protein
VSVSDFPLHKTGFPLMTAFGVGAAVIVFVTVFVQLPKEEETE